MWTRTLRVRVPKVTGDGFTWNASMPRCAGEVMLAIGTVPPLVVQPFEAGVVARSLRDYVSGGGLRLGVTGLSRSGKTVFVTALINNLIAGSRMPVLAASAEGRITRTRLEPQPDDAVPRFPYEEHLAALNGVDRRWPQSTRRI